MRVRVYAWEYHDDPLRLADEVNECIKSCENLGETVVDADVIIRPNEGAKHGMDYLIIIKYEEDRPTYVPPADEPAEDAPRP